MISPVLDYTTPPAEPPERLTLEDGPGFVRVIFPVSPTWTYLAFVCVCAGFAVLLGVVPVAFIIHWWARTHYRLRIHDFSAISIWNSLTLALRWLGDIFFWLLLAFGAWWRYRRWGRIPNMLVATSGGITFSRLGLLRIQQRHWPASEISRIELLPVFGNLSRGQAVGALTVWGKERALKSFRLSSMDRGLPAAIVERISGILREPAAAKVATPLAIDTTTGF